MSDETREVPIEAVALMNQIEEPKPTTCLVELPCGYLAPDGKIYTDVVVKEIDGAVEDMLASKQISSEQKSVLLISMCIERIGPFSDPAQISQIVPELLVGDSVFLLLMIRSVTVGNEYRFREMCPNCEKTDSFTILLSDLKVVKMPDPAKRVFEAELPRNNRVKFKPLRVKDEQFKSQIGSDTDRATISIMSRIIELNGKRATLDGLKKLGMPIRTAMRKAFEAVEGGVDTTMEYKCTSCSYEFEKELDINQRGFFSPSETPNS